LQVFTWTCIYRDKKVVGDAFFVRRFSIKKQQQQFKMCCDADTEVDDECQKNNSVSLTNCS
jgi:hypothetical protein